MVGPLLLREPYLPPSSGRACVQRKREEIQLVEVRLRSDSLGSVVCSAVGEGGFLPGTRLCWAEFSCSFPGLVSLNSSDALWSQRFLVHNGDTVSWLASHSWVLWGHLCFTSEENFKN